MRQDRHLIAHVDRNRSTQIRQRPALLEIRGEIVLRAGLAIHRYAWAGGVSGLLAKSLSSSRIVPRTTTLA